MLFIHIGFHKTGSSSIQHFAAVTSPQLAATGLVYPEVGRTNAAHFNLAEEIRRSPLYVPSRGSFSDLRELMAADQDKDYLISSEGFDLLDPTQVEDLRDRLPPTPVTILAYIRDMPSMVVSSYLQNAKTGVYFDDFDGFFPRRMRTSRTSAAPVREFVQLRAWANAFGWSSLRVRSLDSAHLDGGELLTDFLKAVGRTWADLGAVPEDAKMGRNISPGWKTVELLRSLHRSAGGFTGQEQNQAFRQIRRGSQVLRAVGERIGKELGLDADRGRYLTQPQWDVCEAADNDLKDRLESALEGPSFPRLSSQTFAPREFLPSAEHVPPCERAQFFERTTLSLMEALRALREGEGLARRLRQESGEDLGPLGRQAKLRRQAKRREERLARKQERQAAALVGKS